MKINVTLSAIANAYALINAANALTLDASKVTLGVPAVFEPVGGNPRNTTLILTGVNAGGYNGTKEVKYTRLGMGSGVVAPETGFHIDGTTTLASFKTAVATSLGLVESELELEGVLPAAEGQSEFIKLKAKAGSLLYVGEQDLEVTWPQGIVELNDAITVTDLDGFDPVVA
jgi:hypothetical protein